MTTLVSDKELPFDPDADEFIRDPHSAFRRMREVAPAYDWQARQVLLFTRHDHVRTLLADPRLTAQRTAWEHYQPGVFADERFRAMRRFMAGSLSTLPDVDHGRVRKLASVAFTPRAVERQREAVRRITEELLDQVVAASEDGQINARAFAEGLPIAVIGELVGVAAELRPRFRQFAWAVIRSIQPDLPPEQLGEIADIMTRGEELIEQVIAEHREHPRDDLLSDLLRARDGEQLLSEDELLSLISSLLVAGSDTTVHGLCFAIWNLLRHPEALAEIRADRSLLRNAIDESLRLEPFAKFGSVFRYALEDFELDGVRIPKGKMVIPVITAAAHDPAVFAQPERFDIRRDLSESVNFGFGRHFCLGAHLARLEIEIAITTLLLDRYPHAKLVGEPEFEPSMLLRPMAKLMIAI